MALQFLSLAKFSPCLSEQVLRGNKFGGKARRRKMKRYSSKKAVFRFVFLELCVSGAMGFLVFLGTKLFSFLYLCRCKTSLFQRTKWQYDITITIQVNVSQMKRRNQNQKNLNIQKLEMTVQGTMMILMTIVSFITLFGYIIWMNIFLNVVFWRSFC